MSSRRLLIAACLLTACAVVPMNRAHSQSPKKGQDIPPPRAVIDPKDVEDLKESLTKLKAKTEADAKKLDAALKDAADAKAGLAALQKAADDKAAAEKKDAEPKKLTEEETKAAEAAKKKADEEAEAAKKAAEDEKKATAEGVTKATQRGDTAWMLTASAFVMLMVPGLALFYGGMVRRKNVLATMMQSMAALAVVGVFWVAFGYALAFGPSVITISALGAEDGGLFGWSWDLVFLKGVETSDYLPVYNIPVYAHVMFQGMFAIITPALISGAIAERIRFWPFCLFMVLWITFVYCPLAHMVWAWDWFDTALPADKRGGAAIGLLGKMGALDFAGGTVVHIAAGMAGLACCLVLGKRAGYPKMVAHPNSMVLTLLGAGLLWFGWFGFNGGSFLDASSTGVSAFAATQVAAAAAGLAWMLVEWLHKGKPTALGLASGVVAGLVAVTPASGYVYMGGALCIGVAAAVLCYLAVALKNKLGYDDSLDAFGVHGVGGFVGAILTGVFCSALVNSAGADGMLAFKKHRMEYESLKKDDGKAIKDAKEDAEKADALAKSMEAEMADEIKKLTDAKDEADKKFADAAAGKRDAESDAASEAKKKLEAATEPLTKLQNEAAVKAEAHAKLEADLVTLQALMDKQDADGKTSTSQVWIQVKAAVFSAVFAFVLSFGLCVAVQALTLGNFKTNEKGESLGLDRTEHDEVGFDFSAATESVAVVSTEPRAASSPKGNGRFEVQLTGVEGKELIKVWTDLCQPTDGPVDADFLAVYPYVTTVRGTTFRCRGGDPDQVSKRLASLFKKKLGKDVKAMKVA